MNNNTNFSINQAKLLSSALRMKIISELVHQPKTAKQVADSLGHSAGNVHYHIKKLYDGGLLELVEERQIRGLTEKYYQSKSTWFNTDADGVIDPVLSDAFEGKESTSLSIRLQLSPDQKEEMEKGFRDFLEEWVKKSDVEEVSQEYSVGVKIVSTDPKNES
jgi:DNA-binding transcriptional ArsR family regulator